MINLKQIAPLPDTKQQETDIEHEAIRLLRACGYVVKTRKSGIKVLDSSWPSVQTSKATSKNRPGQPDVILFCKSDKMPFCVWDNKARNVSARVGLDQSKKYIQGLHEKLPHQPNLPRIAAGFNGQQLLLAYFIATGPTPWIDIRADGKVLIDQFPNEADFRSGISSKGVIKSISNSASITDVRKALWEFKTRYRVIPSLTSGRTPIDFTVALLTLRLLVEQHRDWGTWAEQPLLQEGTDKEKQISERLNTLATRVLNDSNLRKRYGDIFKFQEMEGSSEIAFDFIKILSKIDTDSDNFEHLFDIVDNLPSLIDADFDLFGEVYQYIGDDATKKALGEFFTGRHIISGTIPILFARAGLDQSFSAIRQRKMSDIACGTGGFLTEALRWVRRQYNPTAKQVKEFARHSFYGYDLGQANASRARVNMYFAGDGFSVIKGGVDSLLKDFLADIPKSGFDVLMTNPPYGKSKYGLNEEAFLSRFVECMKKGTGWGLIVLPTGVLENPRSSTVRFRLLQHARVTDVISLPKHAFAPYTQQRTAIVIMNRRGKPLPVADDDWPALKMATAHEIIRFYIVDNDGYANSDKRYPTTRKDSNGCWFHDELSPWLDSSDTNQPSILCAALLNSVVPPYQVDEFGAATGPKFYQVALGAIKDDLSESDIRLLPDIYLRGLVTPIPLTEYTKRASEFVSAIKGVRSPAAGSLMRERLKAFLSIPLELDKSIPADGYRLDALFEIVKGDTALTEEVIYNQYDPSGLPVYGGGGEPPRFKIARGSVTKKNASVTVFKAPAIIVSMDGTSGSMRVIEKGEFCINHHGAVLRPKAKTTNLHWIVQQAQAGLRRLASNKGGSSTLTGDAIKSFRIFVPRNSSIPTAVGKLRQKLSRTYQMMYE